MGGGGGKAKTPTLVDDNLKSKQFLRVLDLVSEGPVYGPVDQKHISSVMLNKTPVTNDKGDINIYGVTVAWRNGDENQEPVTGFNAIESTVMVNNEVKKETPLVRTVVDKNVNRIRVNLGVSSLVESDSKGNQNPKASVSMVIETRLSNSGSFVVQKTVIITGKISGEYLEAHIINAPEIKPFELRVRRLTDDSTSDLLQNGTIWHSYTEITDDNLSYPCSAIVGMIVDRDQYKDTPTRTYHARGIIVDIPDNYDPETRQYNGLWTGGFKKAWTNNPAWLFRALIKNNRFGLTRRAGYIDVDDGRLYALSQFCDQMVDDGYGGKEPRFTLNAYLTEQRKARTVLDSIASAVRGSALWDGAYFAMMIDMPTDPVSAITNANVVDGKFVYSSTPRSERYNAVVVSWVDPNNGWTVSKEYVSDDALINRYGYNETTLEAFGCTSRGQAYRTAKWMLETARRETKKVTFDMARDAIAFLPGDVVEVMDNNHVGDRLGGRIKTVTGNKITVDAPVADVDYTNATLSMMGSDGKFIHYDINSIDGDEITLNSDPNFYREGGVFVISTKTIASRLFRITSVKEEDNSNHYKISATLYDQNKQAVVDEGAVFDPPDDTMHGYRAPSIQRLAIISVNSPTVQTKATWETTTTTRNITFEVKVYNQDNEVVQEDETTLFSYDFYGLNAGVYNVGVRARNDNGMKGGESRVEMKIGTPPAPSFINIDSVYFGLKATPYINQERSLDTTFEFFGSLKQITDINEIEDKAERLGRGQFWIKDGLKEQEMYYFYVRSINPFGVSDFVEASGKPDNPIDGILDHIDEAIRDSEAIKKLREGINSSTEAILENAKGLGGNFTYFVRENGKMKAEIVEVRNYVVTETTALAEKLDQVRVTADNSWAAAQNALQAKYDLKKGEASATWTSLVKINYNGIDYDAGMVISAELKNEKVTTMMGFNAQNFAFYNPSNGKMDLFMYLKDGQVFINEAFINEAWINSIVVMNKIQSDNYVPAKSGFLLDAKANKFEMNSSETGGRFTFDGTGLRFYDEKGQARIEIALV
ncbi:phage tail protein [Arsenophonus sp. aPb]|uniref:host specificity protein J n=1 Tax=Arsenophonus sp. aPb TaxID=3041619 RepID=UPI0024699071|nr:phage tail protein [Arsenophonus sp. aPb]WGL99184.1 phage tail protein [Arsenophonus sp. aPb]